MTTSRQRFLRALALGLLATTGALPAGWASDFPARPVRIITFIPNSSAADVLLRTMTAEISRSTGVEFLVENRPGGTGAVAAGAVRASAPDGYTLLLGGSSVMLSQMMRNPAADPFAGFVPVSQVIVTPTVLGLRSDLGVRSIQDLVTQARANPGKITYATAGNGSYAHLMMELFSRRAGVQVLHVPYPQLGNAITDTVGGRIDGVFSLMGTMQPQATAGKITFVGLTGNRRSSLAPNVPTFAESGYPDLGINAWNGVFAPAGTPPAVVEKLAAEFSRAARAPKVLEFARSAALEATPTSEREFADLLAKERSYWQRVLTETGIKGE